MKKILLAIFLILGLLAKSQVYNNEWINYSQTYYKFHLGKTGIYRIPQSVLAAAGLGTVPAEHFQLWRNGVQVPIYTSLASGNFSASDYIEFWGEQNDGKPDRELYRQAAYHLNDKWSLETDTAAYFLTVQTNAANNLRLATTINDVANNTLPAETYFMYTAGKYFRDVLNPGWAVNVGEYLYSSSYDRGEGWTSNNITSAASTTSISYGVNSFTFNNLFVHSGGPDAKFKIAVSGNAVNPRRYKVNINSDSVIGKQVDFFNFSVDTTSFPVSLISSGSAVIDVTNIANIGCYTLPSGAVTCQNDRMVIHKYEITYPRQFNFGGASNFEFTLPASVSGHYLEINNFSFGTTAPVLYDLNNGQRFIGNISAAPIVRFALPPTSQDRKLVLVNEEAANISTITNLQSRTFTNYSSAANAGDYLIITSPVLFNGPGGSNPVEDYRAYRNSAIGGGWNAKLYLAEELIDQFGFGIKKNPAAIRNFIRYARNTFPATPKHVFIIGRGVVYRDQRIYEEYGPVYRENLEKLNLVPTFGNPASDMLLAAEPGSSIPQVSIGRLSVINGDEVALYLNKVKEYELAQATPGSTIAEKAWMKNVVHIVGASEPTLGGIIDHYMGNYKKIISDTLFGGTVTSFSKTSTSAVQQLTNTHLQNLFTEGISLITYFGHSSASTLEFNLDNPENYNNAGKYPVFIGLGCNAGNFFTYSPTRFQTKETLSEKYVLAKDRGVIGFVASTHFGIVHYLDVWANQAYREMSYRNYHGSIGEILKKTVEDVFQLQTQEDFYARSNAEQTEFHGDPALKLNTHPKPDYVIEEPMVRISPNFISVADAGFTVKAKMMNLGKAPGTNIVVEVKREFPDQTITTYRDTIPGIRYMDSINLFIPIDPTHDKGLNKITVTVDADNQVDETYETNNSITREVMIYEDEARPIYPYEFAIINQQNIKLIASTANPFSVSKTYKMELDTTSLFNSPFKVSSTVTTVGGTMEFNPGISFTDSTVYYWRVSPDAGNGIYSWNASSFVYLANSDVGFNQSHLFQHFSSEGSRLKLDSVSRLWSYDDITNNLFIRNAVFPTGGSFAVDFSVSVNGDPYIRSVCGTQTIIVNVIDPVTFKPWKNAPPGSPGLYGSDDVCGPTRVYNFQYRILRSDTSKRRKLMEFMDMIPNGYYVVVRNTSGVDSVGVSYANDWKGDTSYLGSGNSIYHRMLQQGFADIDSINRPRAWIFTYQKNSQDFVPKYTMSQGIYDKIVLSVDCNTPDTIGYITSPVFGPAKAWKEMRWRGIPDAQAGDWATIDLIGINNAGVADTIMHGIDMTQQNVNISSINAEQYPYLQLSMRNADSVNFTPYQLRYWRLTYEPAPEGAIEPKVFFQKKDSVDVAEPLDFKIAFRNVTSIPFDSLKVKMVVTDKNNIQHVIPVQKHKPLPGNDTIHIRYPIDTRQLVGNNSLYVEVNPDKDQPEQYHFNNFAYTDFYVRPDTLHPLLDVTFDNVHILNHDIVSARPDIQIRLKDESKWFMLNDTASLDVQVRYPDGTLRNYYFSNDTMQFVPAQAPPSTNNTATVQFKPYFDQDGEYELIVSGKDMSDNQAGALQYRVSFEVINKPMISNMLNYPNPFTTSTAFVFTITGSEVPQGLRIQILTITGKIVREINKDELGPLHIGRNITEFKWDGTDQYGQKLANGVYIYRVVTNLNGKSLDKYKAEGDKTDKYFNKGYGKMYLMR